MSGIFGGSKQKSQSTSSSSSSNQSLPFLQTNYGATGADAFNSGASALKSELGGGFEGYKDKMGFDFLEKLGLRKGAGSFSGRGAFQSGAALKSLAGFEDNLAKTSYGGYLDKLLQQAQLGMGAGSLIGGAGNVSSSTSQSTGSGSSNNGIGQFLGTILAAAASGSDRRLKTAIERLGELDNGLGIYRYRYVDGTDSRIGVMADEVEKIIPEALGPNIGGYQTVSYNKLAEYLDG